LIIHIFSTEIDIALKSSGLDPTSVGLLARISALEKLMQVNPLLQGAVWAI
jgi:hypothetical protein